MRKMNNSRNVAALMILRYIVLQTKRHTAVHQPLPFASVLSFTFCPSRYLSSPMHKEFQS